MQFKSYITEVFDKPLEWNWLGLDMPNYTAFADFYINGKLIKVEFYHNDEAGFKEVHGFHADELKKTHVDVAKAIHVDGAWDLIFYDENHKGINRYLSTGLSTSDQFSIFATIIDIIREFIKKKSPRVIFFSSTKEKSKESLYDRLLASFAPKIKDMGYRTKAVKLIDDNGMDDGKYYFIFK